MKVAFLKRPGEIEVREIPDPVCPPGGLLTKVEGCAICGSDLRTWEYGAKDSGEIMGHETVSTVIEVGEGVTEFSPGDRIADIPASCGVCEFCKAGTQNLCYLRGRLGGVRQGGFAELRPVGGPAVSGRFVVRIPKDLPVAAAAIIEPLACVLNGHEKIRVGLGSSVAIIGAGPIGAMHVAVSRMRGARQIIVLDLLKSRLQMVESFGPDRAVHVPSADPVEAVMDGTGGRGAEVVIIACVSHDAQRQALEMASRGGQVLFFSGLPQTAPNATLDTNLIHYNELRLVGARSSVQRQWELALALIVQGRIDASKLVTHSVSLDRIQEGFRLAKSGQAMKVLVVP